MSHFQTNIVSVVAGNTVGAGGALGDDGEQRCWHPTDCGTWDNRCQVRGHLWKTI